ncbi:transcriptional regulator, AraC family [Candidatus Burkholderia brachyanthoides]|nr:transcriptional regulator, AraC family [Candidatus Burkholderia brachyanthoides]
MNEFANSFGDPHALEAHYAKLNAEIRIRPDASDEPFRYEERIAFNDDVLLLRTMSHTSYTVDVRTAADAYVVSIPLEGRMTWHVEGECRRGEMNLVSDLKLIKGARIEAGTSTSNVVFSSHALHSDLARLLGAPCHKRLKFERNSGLKRDDALALYHTAYALAGGLSNSTATMPSPITIGYLRQALSTILLQGCRHNFSDQLRSVASGVMPVRIKRAMDYLYANAESPIMLADIAESVSLTVRGLQVGFLRHQGMSPMAFLRKIRLERAREDLLDPDIRANANRLACAGSL